MKTNPTADPLVRAAANEASAFLEAVQSAINGLAQQVSEVDPLAAIPPRLRGPTEIDSPFLSMGPRGGASFPIENMATCRLQSGSSGGTAGTSRQISACVIMKEVFGIKAVLYRRIIPVYQEPWDVRTSPIIGRRVVWYVRWVPAEHLKSIIYEQGPTGGVKMRIEQRDILMPGLSKMWSFYPPALPQGPGPGP